MREAVLELMSILARGAEADDECADQLADTAADAAIAGDHLIASGMIRLARHHRIRALELRGTLAALSAEHGGFFPQDLTED